MWQLSRAGAMLSEPAGMKMSSCGINISPALPSVR